MPKRIQLSRRRGWRMPANTVKVDRSTIFGNPFPVDIYGQAGAVDRFRRWINGTMSTFEMSQISRNDRWSGEGGVSLSVLRKKMLSDIARLRGRNLACWCRPGAPCHADVLLETANSLVCEAA